LEGLSYTALKKLDQACTTFSLLLTSCLYLWMTGASELQIFSFFELCFCSAFKRLFGRHSSKYWCDRKSRAACAQSFAPWQQATIEIMRRNLSSRTLVVTFNRSQVNIGRASTSHSLLLSLARATCIMVLFFAHIPFVVNHTINATPPEWLQ